MRVLLSSLVIDLVPVYRVGMGPAVRVLFLEVHCALVKRHVELQPLHMLVEAPSTPRQLMV